MPVTNGVSLLMMKFTINYNNYEKNRFNDDRTDGY